MTISIVVQPADSTVVEGQDHTFFATVTATIGPISTQWYLDGQAVDGETAPTFTLTATEVNSYSSVYALFTDDGDGNALYSDTVLAITEPLTPTLTRHALHWRYDDNTFHWADPAVEIEEPAATFALYDVDFQAFGFTPGFQQRWEDYSAITWTDTQSGGASEIAWADTFSIGDATELIQLSNGSLYQAEQSINRVGSLKRHYVTRTQIDLDDMVPDWTSNKIKYINQFIFHMQSEQRIVDTRDSNFGFYVGWSMNLMDTPNWKAVRVVDLENSANGGDYKVDYRTSGRYLAISFDVTEASQFAMTGGDMLAAEAGGR